MRAPGRGLAANVRAERIREVAELLEIAELLERRPNQLSGGQRQRVSLGRALVRDANATLLDEPIAHLDARLRNALRGELKHYLKSHGATVLYATPDYVEAFGIADVVAILIAGQIHQVGPPEEIYAAPASLAVAELVGDPRMNVLAVENDGTLALGGYRTATAARRYRWNDRPCRLSPHRCGRGAARAGRCCARTGGADRARRRSPNRAGRYRRHAGDRQDRCR